MVFALLLFKATGDARGTIRQRSIMQLFLVVESLESKTTFQ